MRTIINLIGFGMAAIGAAYAACNHTSDWRGVSVGFGIGAVVCFLHGAETLAHLMSRRAKRVDYQQASRSANLHWRFDRGYGHRN